MRIPNFYSALPAALEAQQAIDTAVRETALARAEPRLIDLIYLHISNLNGCAYCIDMHVKDAIASGEDPRRLYMLPAFRESPRLYTDRERAALAWAECLTRLEAATGTDPVYEAVAAVFDDDEITALNWAIVAINSYNRLNRAVALGPGNYVSKRTAP
jgi:AhpD family alkylhydroperoxidase